MYFFHAPTVSYLQTIDTYLQTKYNEIKWNVYTLDNYYLYKVYTLS